MLASKWVVLKFWHSSFEAFSLGIHTIPISTAQSIKAIAKRKLLRAFHIFDIFQKPRGEAPFFPITSPCWTLPLMFSEEFVNNFLWKSMEFVKNFQWKLIEFLKYFRWKSREESQKNGKLWAEAMGGLICYGGGLTCNYRGDICSDMDWYPLT